MCCASSRLGSGSGVLLGAATGIAITIAAGPSYGAGFGLWAVAAAILIGGIGGLLVGTVTGTVLHLLASTVILRNRAHGLSPARLSPVAFLITGLASFALLDVLFHGSPGILIYPPAAAAALLAIPLGRRLPLSRQPPKGQ
jgi:hypothetical protein